MNTNRGWRADDNVSPCSPFAHQVKNMFLNFVKSLLPKVQAEEVDLVDPQTTLREKCQEKAECQPFKLKFEECEARVRSRTKTAETCTEELIDFLHCAEHCVAHELFHHLK